MSDLPFNSWKFWLSSAVFFAGVLTAGLIASCAKGENPLAHLGVAQPVCYQYGRQCVDGDVVVVRILGALLKLNQRPHSEKTRSVILGALGAMNFAATHGVRGGREAIVANLLVGMVSDIEAIAHGTSA